MEQKHEDSEQELESLANKLKNKKHVSDDTFEYSLLETLIRMRCNQ